MKKGPLVRVQLQPGRFVKMHEEDAIAQGLLESKARSAGQNKMRTPAANKGAGEQGGKGAGEPDTPPDPPPADDLTAIAGVGKATARALQARGIDSFEKLRQATPEKLNFLGKQALQAIEDWKDADDAG